MITFDDFQKLDIRIGTIITADIVPDADKLIVLLIDTGEEKVQIVSGIREYFPDPDVLIGKQVPVLVNLEPKVIRGHESRGMVLYVVGDKENFTTLEPAHKVNEGTPVQ